jgi:1,4-dihydroxy-2-naphthoate octaprenyltransferase
LTTKQANLKQLFVTATLFLTVSLVFGAIIYLYRGDVILYLGLAGGVLGFAYSSKPFCLSYRGLGELTVGIMFGPLLMFGVFYAGCGVYVPAIGVVSVSAGLLVANILFTHSILDYQPDKYMQKKTLAVLIKSPKVLFILSTLFTLSPFLIVGYGLLFNYLSWWYGLVILAFPWGIYLIYLIGMFFRYPKKAFSPCFFTKPMENWDKIEQKGLGWFMLRWYLSRNLTMFFCILAIIASLISL